VGGSRSINLFLAKIFGLSFFWLISENWLSHISVLYNHIWIYFYHVLLVILLKLSVFVFSFTNYSILHGYDTISIVGSAGVRIGNPCVGFGLLFGFFALIVSYPAPWKKKLWFIPLGSFLIIFINVIRIVSLTISQYKNGDFMKLEQHDFYNYIVYALIFILWVVWVKFVVPESDVFSPENNSDSPNRLS
jgi:exosortase/archaeosortase family protein